MKIKKLYEEYIKPGYSYMLRNDGKLINVGHAHPYIIQSGGEMFKNNFTKLFTHVVNSMGFINFKWLYDNTNNSKTRELIKEFFTNLFSSKNQLDKFDDDLIINVIKDDFENYFGLDLTKELDIVDEVLLAQLKAINEALNQEFLRLSLRGSYGAQKGGVDDLIARVSSIGFNWYDLLFKLVYDNKNQINRITIERDYLSRPEAKSEFLKVGDLVIKNVTPEEFMWVKTSRPQVESFKIKDDFKDTFCEEVFRGASLTEALGEVNIIRAMNTIESIKTILGKDSIIEDICWE